MASCSLLRRADANQCPVLPGCLGKGCAEGCGFGGGLKDGLGCGTAGGEVDASDGAGAVVDPAADVLIGPEAEVNGDSVAEADAEAPAPPSGEASSRRESIHSTVPMVPNSTSVSHGKSERLLRRGRVGSTGRGGSRSLSLTPVVASRGGSGGRMATGCAIGPGDSRRIGTDGGGDMANSVRATPSISAIAWRTSSRISAALP